MNSKADISPKKHTSTHFSLIINDSEWPDRIPFFWFCFE